jgi:hypothetical protein
LALMQSEFAALDAAIGCVHSIQSGREGFGGICRFEYQAERAGEF